MAARKDRFRRLRTEPWTVCHRCGTPLPPKNAGGQSHTQEECDKALAKAVIES